MKSYQNEIGFFLKHLRVDYSESVKEQSDRLGCNPSYIYMLGTDKRPFSIWCYKTICEHYRVSESDRKKMVDWLIKEDVQKRFFEKFPDAELKELFYVLYGDCYE